MRSCLRLCPPEAVNARRPVAQRSGRCHRRGGRRPRGAASVHRGPHRHSARPARGRHRSRGPRRHPGHQACRVPTAPHPGLHAEPCRADPSRRHGQGQSLAARGPGVRAGLRRGRDLASGQPAPSRGHPRFTPDRRSVFLDHLEAALSVTAVAAEVGITTAVYQRRKRNPAFAAAHHTHPRTLDRAPGASDWDGYQQQALSPVGASAGDPWASAPDAVLACSGVRCFR